MSVESLLYGVLSGWTPLTNLVQSRISPMKSLEYGQLPGVTFINSSGAGLMYTQEIGAVDMRDPLFQIDSWGRTYDEARAVNAQVLASLDVSDSPPVGFWAFIEDDGTSMFEPETKFHRCMIMARIWHRGP